MTEPLPTVFIPGLFLTPRFFQTQLAAAWRFGPVVVADHTRDDTMAGIARRVLESAPPRFALVGHSMGGYAAFEILRQAGDRVARLALLDTSARADTPEQSGKRREQIALARAGRYDEIPEMVFPKQVHPDRATDTALFDVVRRMAADTGTDAFVRQQNAILAREDSRAGLQSIRCPTVVIVGDGDQITPPDIAEEIARGIVGSRVVTIANSGHLSAIEQPDAVADALVAWLAQSSASR